MVEHLDMNVLGETADVKGELSSFLPRIVPRPEVLGIGHPASREGTRPRRTKDDAGHNHWTQDRAPTRFVDAEDHGGSCSPIPARSCNEKKHSG
jgi:hypothetical protein